MKIFNNVALLALLAFFDHSIASRTPESGNKPTNPNSKDAESQTEKTVDRSKEILPRIVSRTSAPTEDDKLQKYLGEEGQTLVKNTSLKDQAVTCYAQKSQKGCEETFKKLYSAFVEGDSHPELGKLTDKFDCPKTLQDAINTIPMVQYMSKINKNAVDGIPYSKVKNLDELKTLFPEDQIRSKYHDGAVLFYVVGRAKEEIKSFSQLDPKALLDPKTFGETFMSVIRQRFEEVVGKDVADDPISKGQYSCKKMLFDNYVTMQTFIDNNGGFEKPEDFLKLLGAEVPKYEEKCAELVQRSMTKPIKFVSKAAST